MTGRGLHKDPGEERSTAQDFANILPGLLTEYFSATSHVTIPCRKGIDATAFPRARGLFDLTDDGAGIVSLRSDVYDTLNHLPVLSGQVLGTPPRTARGFIELFRAKSACATLIHEHIHALGVADRGQFARLRSRKIPGGWSLSEGITELATQTFLNVILEKSGMLLRYPQLENSGWSTSYAAPTRALSELITPLALHEGRRPEDLCRELAATGSAFLMRERLTTGFLSLFPPNEQTVMHRKQITTVLTKLFRTLDSVSGHYLADEEAAYGTRMGRQAVDALAQLYPRETSVGMPVSDVRALGE